MLRLFAGENRSPFGGGTVASVGADIPDARR